VRLLQGGGSKELQIARQRPRWSAWCSGTEAWPGTSPPSVAQRLPSSRSPAMTQVLLDLAAGGGGQQLCGELAPSPSCMARLAQLASNPSQDPVTQRLALGVLAGPMLMTSLSAVAVVPHHAVSSA
jgi:hypothetical protein